MREAAGTLAWYVAHTRPRCEKKLAEYCEREGLAVTLPLYRSVKKYRGKVVEFEKPLFPNYVFLRLTSEQRKKAYQSDWVANLLDVPDQESFEEQMRDILTALETDYEICVLPNIATGSLMSIPIEFRMTLVSGGSLILASSVPGLDPTLGAVVDTLGGGNFQVKLEFVALGLPDTGLNDVKKLESAGSTMSSFGGGFYWTDPVSTNVPEGGSSAWIIVPTALAFIAARRVFSAA